FVYSHRGFDDECMRELEREQKTNPDYGNYWVRIGALADKGNHKEALRLLETIPDGAFPHPRIKVYLKAVSLYYDHRAQEAATLLESYPKDKPNDPLLTSFQAVIEARAGRTNEARAKIAMASVEPAERIDSHHTYYNIGSVYALMNDSSEAISWLKKAADHGNPCYSFFKTDPNLARLQGNPEFQA